MKQLLDFIPLIIFFAMYQMYDIFTATGGLMAATTIQIVLTFFLYKKVEKMQLITFVLVTLLGGMTLILHDANFIKWKVTIAYSLFALGLVVTQFMGKPVIKGMLGKEISLPDSMWNKINWAWVGFFVSCALLNVYIAFNLPTEVWVDFKVIGLTVATFAYTLLTGVYIYKNMPKQEPEE